MSAAIGAFFGILFLCILHVNVAHDSFTEDLFIKPFQSGHVLTHFQLVTKWEADFFESSVAHYRLFPKALGEVLKKYNVQELHLTQTQGLWRSEKWGYPVVDSPPGAELWVWFKEDTQELDLERCLTRLNCMKAASTVSVFISDPSVPSTSVELLLSLATVFDPTTSREKQDWNFRQLFGNPLMTSCSLADESHIYVDISDAKSGTKFTLTPPPEKEERFLRGKEPHLFAVYDVHAALKRGPLNLKAEYDGAVHRAKIHPPVLTARRFQTGYGQASGGVKTIIENNHPRKDIAVSYMEVVPWYMRVYLHTLKIVNKRDAAQNGTKLTPKFKHYKPGRDRQRPYFLELVLKLPAKSSTSISFEFDKALLKWTEYPPDANHGFYIPSATISAQLDTSANYTAPTRYSSILGDIFGDPDSEWFIRLRTETLLVTLPTPDFSMPYNVICLTCTVVAIAFGSVHNLTTREFTLVDLKKEKSPLAKVKAFIMKNILNRSESKATKNVCSDTKSEDKKDR